MPVVIMSPLRQLSIFSMPVGLSHDIKSWMQGKQGSSGACVGSGGGLTPRR